jgi:hypothetical protein
MDASLSRYSLTLEIAPDTNPRGQNSTPFLPLLGAWTPKCLSMMRSAIEWGEPA